MALLLSRSDVESVLDMQGTIEILEKAFVSLSEGHAKMPIRTPIRAESYGGLALFMPAMLDELGALGAKIVTVYKDNPSRFGIPNVLGTIILLDVESGDPVCIMEAGFLTAMRTGGASGVATKHMARRDSAMHVLFGTGVQARTQAWAVAEAAPSLKECVVLSIDAPDKKQAFAESVEKLTGVPTRVGEDCEEATRIADIVTLSTSAAEPIVFGEWLKPGVHINSVGAHTANMREIDTVGIVKSRVVCDHIESCKVEAGDLIIPQAEGAWSFDKVCGELGRVVNGTIAGRESDADITFFKSVGLAIQDMSVARFVYEKAKKLGKGVEFAFR
jgi:ornithine cyclodeaminase/alanine dehydrogenase-like protein (mu-crystallin family)